MKDLTLKCHLPLGDVVLLTAAVRDLHLSYPQRFRTAVQTQFPELWDSNPYVTDPRLLAGPDVIECKYTLVNQSNSMPYHVIHAFHHFLSERLGIKLEPTKFSGDIYISHEEKQWCSQVHEITGSDIPFWIIVSGGKNDATVKWWPVSRFQAVVDHFKGKIQFVQVGAAADFHPPLKEVIDLRGKTDCRQLVRLVYHSQGVLCPVTSLMHLAAAIETKAGTPKNRPCVVVAGGREPSQWEAYPHHQFIHTNGSLACCDQGGCWKSRTRPLGDGSEFDQPANLCLDPVDDTPRCMEIITVDQVIRRIEMYFVGGSLHYAKLEPSLADIEEAAPKVETTDIEVDAQYLVKQKPALDALPTARLAQHPSPHNNVALVSVVKNEGPYLLEWIGYHLMLGVEHIYLYDDGSNDNSLEAYQIMYKTGRLTVHRALKTGRRHNMQEDCNEEWRRQYGHLYKFMMPWDGDEFLALKEGATLQKLLDAIPQNVGQVRLNWKLFGSANQLYADFDRFVIERFTKHCLPNTEHLTKLILRVEAMGAVDYETDQSRAITVHCSSILPEYRTVGGDLHTEVEGAGTAITPTIWNGWAVCNHYAVKSVEEFLTIKKTKPKVHVYATFLEAGTMVTNDYFPSRDKNDLTDEAMLRHVAPLRNYIEKVKAIVLPYG
jgi:ADP-heptose:LPS heptosyltransferase